MTSTMWAALIAPMVAGALYLPGKLVYRYLWRRMPDGKLRDFLLKER
jgi:hypothetical protein